MNNPIRLYLAGPIDLGTDVPNWRSILVNMLNDNGLTTVAFDPSTAYKTSMWGTPDASRSLYIEQLNRHALDMANVFIALLPRGTPSIGTPIEIEFADKSNGVSESFVITDIKRGHSVYLDNRIDEHNWIYIKDLSDTKTVQSALSYLADLIVKRYEHVSKKQLADLVEGQP